MCENDYVFSFYSCPADPIDVLQVLELSQDMEGVSLEAGLCTSRTGFEEPDLAYKIDKKIQLSAPTRQLFPGMGLRSPMRISNKMKCVTLERHSPLGKKNDGILL